MNWLLLWDWLTTPPPLTFSSEEVSKAQAEGYAIGLAHGELLGRQALSRELEQMFPPMHAMNAEDVQTVKARQIH